MAHYAPLQGPGAIVGLAAGLAGAAVMAVGLAFVWRRRRLSSRRSVTDEGGSFLGAAAATAVPSAARSSAAGTQADIVCTVRVQQSTGGACKGGARGKRPPEGPAEPTLVLPPELAPWRLRGHRSLSPTQ